MAGTGSPSPGCSSAAAPARRTEGASFESESLPSRAPGASRRRDRGVSQSKPRETYSYSRGGVPAVARSRWKGQCRAAWDRRCSQPRRQRLAGLRTLLAGQALARLCFPGSTGNAGLTDRKGRKNGLFFFFLRKTSGDDKVPKMLRRALAQLSLSSMKSADLCVGRPALLTSAGGRQEVRSFLVPISAFLMLTACSCCIQ